MAHKIGIDFFRVQVPNGSKSFHEIVSIISKAPASARNSEIGGSPVRLQSETNYATGIEGEVIRIQMDDLPPKAGLDGSVGPLGIADNEGIGHETAFLYYTPLRVLVLQRRKSGVSPGVFARYFENLAELLGPIDLEPVAMPDAIAKLLKFKTVRKLQVRIAGLERLKAFESDNQSVNGLIKIAQESRSPVVELELSAGLKRKDSVDKAGVINTIKGLMGLPANVVDVQKIDVRGRADDDQPVDHLRLLDFVMTEKGTVVSEGRQIPYHSRAQAIRDAFKRRKQELEKMFGQPQDTP